MLKFNLFFILSLGLNACTFKTTCLDSDKGCLQEQVNQHVVRTTAYWKNYHNLLVEDRIFTAPQELIDYLNINNRKNGFSNKTVSAVVSKEFLLDVREAVKEIPASVKKLLTDKLVGIYLVNDLGGTSYAESILNDKGEPYAGFIILDANVLKNHKANTWATWKEQTPFKSDQSFTIETEIEDSLSDTRKAAIQYILLHEIGHVISIGERYHSDWNIEPKNIKQTEHRRFFNESWKHDWVKKKVASKFNDTFFTDRTSTVYYFGAKLEGNQMVDIYSRLEKTDFVTLFATTNVNDDWAESFVTYVHSVLLKKPFQITIKKNGQIQKQFKLCWGTKRCSRKEAILAKILNT